MLIGVIADDFTGAGDIAITLAKGLPGQGGLRTAQFLGVPESPAPAGVEAGVVALKTRSVPVAEAVETSLAALDWLLAQGARQIVFKYCSTFDSTPTGNIGPVAEALAERLGASGVIVCPAFPAMGRTVYQGHLFVFDRLLSESGMQNHPLTPMTDPDLRRWLAHQATGPVGHVPAALLREGADAVRGALDAAAGRGEALVVTDALSETDLVTLARAASGARLITGGSGIALGLPANFIDAGVASGSGFEYHGIDGPEAIIAGSCSGATLGQIEHHAKNHPVMAIGVDEVMSGQIDSAALVGFFEANRGGAPLVFSSGTPEEVKAAQARHGREAVSARLDGLFGDTARSLRDRGTRRIVVAGGETSGAVAQALDLGALQIGPEIDPGVPILVGGGGSVGLALKSGNFGARDFFAKALDALRGGPAQ